LALFIRWRNKTAISRCAFHDFDFAPGKDFPEKITPAAASRHKRSAAVSRRPVAARTNIEMPVVFIARANFARSGTLFLVAQASGLLFPASRRKPFATNDYCFDDRQPAGHVSPRNLAGRQI